MTEPKILSPQEALRALAEGKKLTREGWNNAWIDYKLLQDGNAFLIGTFDEFYEYTEPAPKVVWVEYLCFHIKDNKCIGTEWYQSTPPDPDVWTYTPTGRKIEV